MSRNIPFRYGIINITIHPHTPSQYEELLRDACSSVPPFLGKYRGDEWMTLSLQELDGLQTGSVDFPYLAGTIDKFTRISDEEWFDSQRGVAVTDEERPQFDIQRYHPNHVSFPFVFLPQGHRLFFVNTLYGKKISPSFFTDALNHWLDRPNLKEKFGDIAVNLETDNSGIEAMLRIEKLQKLNIKVNLPNGDDLSDEEEEWIERFRKQNVVSINETLKAQQKHKLNPDKTTIALMHLAQSNGTIVAEGYTNSEKVVLKSEEFPVNYRDTFPEGESIFRKLLAGAKEKLAIFSRRNTQ